MALGLGVLKLPPAAFWAMTPRELAAALRGLHRQPPPGFGRNRLAELMRCFPDRGDGHG